MADKFLNLTGLSYFWQKIKSALNLKQDTLTAGTGIDITSNVVTNKYTDLANTDLNTVNYTYLGYSGSGTNYPSGATRSGQLMSIIRETGLYGMQIYKGYQTSSLYYRQLTNGTWESWKELTHSFNAGDVFTASIRTQCAGLLTGSSKQIRFTIPVPKPINATSVTATSLILAIRGVGGGYIFAENTNILNQPDVSVTTHLTNSGISVYLLLTNAVSSGLSPNNAPLVVNIDSDSSFTFS